MEQIHDLTNGKDSNTSLADPDSYRDRPQQYNSLPTQAEILKVGKNSFVVKNGMFVETGYEENK